MVNRGDFVGPQWQEYGLTLSASGGENVLPRIFDTANPLGQNGCGDADLGSPVLSLDGSRPLLHSKIGQGPDGQSIVCVEDRHLLQLIERLSVKSIILVFNKIDLVSGRPDTILPDNLRFVPRVNTSAIYNQGIDTLKDLIAETAVGGASVDAQNALIPNLRHQLKPG